MPDCLSLFVDWCRSRLRNIKHFLSLIKAYSRFPWFWQRGVWSASECVQTCVSRTVSPLSSNSDVQTDGSCSFMVNDLRIELQSFCFPSCYIDFTIKGQQTVYPTVSFGWRLCVGFLVFNHREPDNSGGILGLPVLLRLWFKKSFWNQFHFPCCGWQRQTFTEVQALTAILALQSTIDSFCQSEALHSLRTVWWLVSHNRHN